MDKEGRKRRKLGSRKKKTSKSERHLYIFKTSSYFLYLSIIYFLESFIWNLVYSETWVDSQLSFLPKELANFFPIITEYFILLPRDFIYKIQYLFELISQLSWIVQVPLMCLYQSETVKLSWHCNMS